MTIREVLGESFVIIDDPEGTRAIAVADRLEAVQGHTGLIRAVRSSATAEGYNALKEEPPGEWFFDYMLPDGQPGLMSGNGIRVYARYLLEQGHLSITDRRDTIAIGTRVGVRDVLFGVSAIAVDLGGWRLIESDPTRMTINLAGERVTIGNDVAPQSVGTEALYVLSDERNISVTQSVAHASVTVCKHGVNAPSSGIGAAAAAIALRHWASSHGPTRYSETQQVPHHWRISMPGGSGPFNRDDVEALFAGES